MKEGESFALVVGIQLAIALVCHAIMSEIRARRILRVQEYEKARRAEAERIAQHMVAQVKQRGTLIVGGSKPEWIQTPNMKRVALARGIIERHFRPILRDRGVGDARLNEWLESGRLEQIVASEEEGLAVAGKIAAELEALPRADDPLWPDWKRDCAELDLDEMVEKYRDGDPRRLRKLMDRQERDRETWRTG